MAVLLHLHEVGVVVPPGLDLAEDDVALVHLLIESNRKVATEVVAVHPGMERPATLAVGHRLALLELGLDELVAHLAQSSLLGPIRMQCPVRIELVARPHLMCLQDEVRHLAGGHGWNACS